jgi:hypothetical protein
MATALVLVDANQRGTNDKGERYWKRHALIGTSSDNESAWAKAIQMAGHILDWTPEVAQQVAVP